MLTTRNFKLCFRFSQAIISCTRFNFKSNRDSDMHNFNSIVTTQDWEEKIKNINRMNRKSPLTPYELVQRLNIVLESTIVHKTNMLIRDVKDR